MLNRYVRDFHRTRNRDGALFRGRFRSRPVTSQRYRYTLMRYIAQNVVQARLASGARPRAEETRSQAASQVVDLLGIPPSEIDIPRH